MSGSSAAAGLTQQREGRTASMACFRRCVMMPSAGRTFTLRKGRPISAPGHACGCCAKARTALARWAWCRPRAEPLALRGSPTGCAVMLMSAPRARRAKARAQRAKQPRERRARAAATRLAPSGARPFCSRQPSSKAWSSRRCASVGYFISADFLRNSRLRHAQEDESASSRAAAAATDAPLCQHQPRLRVLRHRHVPQRHPPAPRPLSAGVQRSKTAKCKRESGALTSPPPFVRR